MTPTPDLVSDIAIFVLKSDVKLQPANIAYEVTTLWRYRNECIIRLFCSTTYLDAAYCYRPSSMVCRSVCLSVSLSQ